METLTFTTPTGTQRAPHTLTVDWCGHPLTLDRPKDFVLGKTDTIQADSDSVTDTARALAVQSWLRGTLGEDGYNRFLQRGLDHDDPLDVGGTLELIFRCTERWLADTPDTSPLTIAPDTGSSTAGEPAHIRNPDLGLDFIAHPPKDIVMMILTAYSGGAPMLAVDYFINACLDKPTAMQLKRRLVAPTTDDSLDVAHLDPILEDLITRWSPDTSTTTAPANRDERRAATRR